ncbi:hypothetical protein SAMN04488109_1769 [Chryseolinea serpens]|uniref:Uncharacterized protein n=1 Tax=Chryseolinea serpens TaxID=947013 RepID=A0A1M5MJH1_9BACT|nr:hypothetical protein SAMN04488109_1769 [Chryseolinea serpens]
MLLELKSVLIINAVSDQLDPKSGGQASGKLMVNAKRNAMVSHLGISTSAT